MKIVYCKYTSTTATIYISHSMETDSILREQKSTFSGINTEAEPYMALIFQNREDFKLYKDAVNLKPENVGLSANDFSITVLVKTEILVPSGFLTVKTSKGREITIKISSSFAKRI